MAEEQRRGAGAVSELALGIAGALGSACTWALICILAQALSGRLTSAGINAFRALVGSMALGTALRDSFAPPMKNGGRVGARLVI